MDKPVSLSGQRSWQVQGLSLALTLGTLVWQIKNNRIYTVVLPPHPTASSLYFVFKSPLWALILSSGGPIAPRGCQTLLLVAN